MLRQAKPSDAEAIEHTRVAAWKQAYRGFMPLDFLDKLSPVDRVASLRERLDTQGSHYVTYVEDMNQQIVGFFCLGKPRYEAPSTSSELWALYVNPLFWRMGIGSRLLERSISTASSMGYTHLELWCLKGNKPAQLTYEKYDFVLTGLERNTAKLTGMPLEELQYAKALGDPLRAAAQQ